MINYYIAQSRGFYFKNILVASNFGVTPMGGLSQLGLFLVRCSTNMGQEDNCSRAPEELNAELKPGFLGDITSPPAPKNLIAAARGPHVSNACGHSRYSCYYT